MDKHYNSSFNLVSAQNLSFAYANNNKVLQNLSFNLKTGDFIILTGSNGAGKSTLFNLILGFLKPSGGILSVMGDSPQKSFQNISYIPQQTALSSFSLKVIDVVAGSFVTAKSLFFFNNNKHKEKAYATLEKMSLTDIAHKSFNTLSGGQVQKVLLARAISNPKSILLLDEPMANVDVESKQFIYEFLKELTKNMAIIMISHDISFLSGHVGKVLHLNNGFITEYKNVKEMEQQIFHNHTHFIGGKE